MTMEIQLIPIERISLDWRNPRIAHTLEAMSEAPSQDFIEMSLGLHAPEDEERGASTTYSSLKASIRANKGLILPIIVSPRGDGTFLVVEGNTRVAIYRELAEEEAPGDWSHIPAIVQALNEEGEHAVRLQAHLVGPRPWRPYAKAKYLHDLYVNKKFSITEILDYCGGTARRREIEQYIDAYKDMHEYYVPLVQGAGEPPDYSRFSAFVELQKTPGLKQAVARAGYTMSDFSQWLHDGKIMPLQDVRKLERIFANPQAKKEFERHNTREAIKILEQPSSNAVISSASLEQLARALAAKMRSLNWPDVQALMANTQGEASESLIDCFEELKTLVKQLGQETDE
jgi:hypothetical protein